MAEDLTDIPEEYHATIEAVFETRTEGLKKNRDTVLDEKKALAAKLKSFSDKYAAIEASAKALDVFKEGHDALMGRVLEKSLLAEIATLATNASLHPEAIEDATTYALKVFTLNDDGSSLVHPDGKDVPTWLQDLRKTKPHFFRQSDGRQDHGGGSSRVGGGDYTLTRTDASDHQKWKKAMAAAKKAGLEAPVVLDY